MINIKENLNIFIKEKLKSEFTKEQIKKTLIEKGWGEEIINKALNE